jgi:hypothetical protein
MVGQACTPRSSDGLFADKALPSNKQHEQELFRDDPKDFSTVAVLLFVNSWRICRYVFEALRFRDW